MMKVSKQYKYQAIADDIKTEIFSKHMKGNSPLPSIRQYAVKYGVTSNTIVSALHLLRNNKIIYPHRTKRYCIVADIEERRLAIANELIQQLITDIKKIGFTEQEISKIIQQ